MFNAFIAKKSGSAKGGSVLKVGDKLSLRLRNDGNGGFVLVVGRTMIGDKYGSRKNPIAVTVKITALDGKVSEEVLAVTDADGVHLGQANKVEVEKYIASLKEVEVKKIG